MGSSMSYHRSKLDTTPIKNEPRMLNLGTLINSKKGFPNFPPVRWIDMAISMASSLKKVNEQEDRWVLDIDPTHMAFNPETRSIIYKNVAGSSLSGNLDKQGAICGPIDKHHPNKDNIAPELKHTDKTQVVCNEKTEVYGLGRMMTQLFKKQMKGQLLDPAEHESISNFLKKMTAKGPDERPSLKEVENFFIGIRQGLLNTPALLNRVVLIDVDEYRKVDGEDLQTMNKSLQGAHEVWLFQKGPSSEQEETHETVLQRLKNTFYLADTAAINMQVINVPENSSIADTVKVHAHARGSEDNNIYICGVLNTDGEVAYPENVAPKHLEKIIQSLESDLARINKKYPGPNSHTTRKGAMGAFIAQLKEAQSNNKPLTYNKLIEDLNSLQSQLTSKHLFKRLTSSLTDSTFHASRENVKQLIESTEKITPSPRVKR